MLDLRAAERAAELEMGYGDVEAAFAIAAHVIRAEFTIGRHSAVPLETRGLLAAPRDGRLEIWGTTKVPHFNRRLLASMLGVPVEQISLHTADAGGGFGVRGEFYPEDFLVPWLAVRDGSTGEVDRGPFGEPGRDEPLAGPDPRDRGGVRRRASVARDRRRGVARQRRVHPNPRCVRRRPHARHAARSVQRARVPRRRARGAHRPNPVRDLPRARVATRGPSPANGSSIWPPTSSGSIRSTSGGGTCCRPTSSRWIEISRRSAPR